MADRTIDVGKAIDATLSGVVSMATRTLITLYDYVAKPGEFARFISTDGESAFGRRERPLTYATALTVVYLFAAWVTVPYRSESGSGIPAMQYILRFSAFLAERVVSGGLEGLVLVVLPILAFYILGTGVTVLACRIWRAKAPRDQMFRVTCYGGGSYLTLALPFVFLFPFVRFHPQLQWALLLVFAVPVSLTALRWSQLIKSVSRASWPRTVVIIVTALVLFEACLSPVFLYQGDQQSNSALQRTAPRAAAELER